MNGVGSSVWTLSGPKLNFSFQQSWVINCFTSLRGGHFTYKIGVESHLMGLTWTQLMNMCKASAQGQPQRAPPHGGRGREAWGCEGGIQEVKSG